VSDPNGAASEIREGKLVCPECDRPVTVTKRGLAMHRNREHGVQSPTSSAARGRADEPKAPAAGPRAAEGASVRPLEPLRSRPEELQAVEDELVVNLGTLGTLLMAVAPHTGITVMSRAIDREITVPTADGQTRSVRRRGIASVVMGYAERDPRILRGVRRFNAIFGATEAADLAAQLGAAVALDAGIDPEAGVRLPGPIPIQLTPGTMIPDVVQQVAEMREAAAEEERQRQAQQGMAPEPEWTAAQA
jgi:hypothetical protein